MRETWSGASDIMKQETLQCEVAQRDNLECYGNKKKNKKVGPRRFFT
jgi:hypothetical protein